MQLKELSELIFDMIPLLDHKFVKPVEIEFRSTVTQTQVTILSLLRKNDMTMKELSEAMTISKQQMTIPIEKLVKKKYATRKTSPDDRRIIVMAITSDGLDLLEKIHSFTLTVLEEQMKAMRPDDQAVLAQAAAQLHHVISKYA